MTEEIRNTYDGANRIISSVDSEGETSYLYDANGNQIRKTQPGEKITEYTYDTENRLLAVTDEKGLLLTALYDGDDNRVFTANRTEDTKEYQLFAPEKKSPQTSPRGEEADIFWYGFGQNFFQAFTLDKDSMGKVWMDIWEDTVSAFHRKILKDRADEEGIVVNPDKIEAGEEITLPGAGQVTYPSQSEEVLIPYGVVEETYDYYEVRNYVNDINQSHSQVLMSYDESGEIEEAYSYGNERLDYMNYVDGEVEASYAYGYDGFGSVAELTNQSGVLETAYSYTPYGAATATGNTTTGNPYNYQAEMVDPSTGNQYLRARYYNQSTGTFQTQDSYLGDIKEPLTRNLYTYAENNPVNFDDPSGHGIWSSIKSGVSKVASKVTSTVKNTYTAVKTTVSQAYSTVKTTVSNAYTAVKSTATKAYNTVKTQVTNTYNNAKTYVTNTYNKVVSTTKAAVSYTQEKAKTAYEKAVEAGTSSYNWVASKSKEAQNIAKNWTKALEENMKHVCTSVKYAGDVVSTFMKNVDWKKVTTGVAVTAGVTLVVVATGGTAAPIIAGAVIGAGSGAVISGGMTAIQGGSIEEVAKAASDGFMWGAIGGGVSGGATSLVSTAAANGSKVAASAVVGKGVDVVTDTSLDVAQTVTSGGKVTLESVLVSAGTSLVLGSTGGGKADDVAGVVHGGPYSQLSDSKNVAVGKNFTVAQKKNIIQENIKNNGGVVKSDLSGEVLVRPNKSQRGVTPPQNEWQIDHIISKDKGGSNSYSNAHVLSRKENREKWNH